MSVKKRVRFFGTEAFKVASRRKVDLLSRLPSGTSGEPRNLRDGPTRGDAGTMKRCTGEPLRSS